MVEALLKAGEDTNEEYKPNSNTMGQFDTPLQTAIACVHSNVDAAAGPVGKGTALQIACKKGYLNLAKQLIGLGANINVDRSPWQNRSALECAAENGRIDMIQLLLSSGASTTGRWRRDYIQAIAIAERNGHRATAQLLRSHRKWTTKDNDKSYLHIRDWKLANKTTDVSESDDDYGTN
ncbi:hypothetical protein K445DRAFT_19308 [Daldinia sp. EC12]|nr:hypothetical protein K445DRAFT_19308 [Daldinia sp. EC12]